MQDPDLIFGDPQKQSTLLPIPEQLHVHADQVTL